MSCTRSLKTSVGLTNASKHRSVLAWQGQTRQTCSFAHTTDPCLSDHVCSNGKRGHRADRSWSKTPSSSAAPPAKGEDKRKCFNCGKTARRTPSLPLRTARPPVQGDVRSFTALSCDDGDLYGADMLGVWILAHASVSLQKCSFSHTSLSTQVPRRRSFLGTGLPPC